MEPGFKVQDNSYKSIDKQGAKNCFHDMENERIKDKSNSEV